MARPFLIYEQQIKLLKGKNLCIEDEVLAEEVLHRYGYFSLVSGYKELLKNPTTKNYRDETRFEDLIAVYQFDERLRKLTLHCLFQVERNIKSALSYAFCDKFGDSEAAYILPQNYDISTPAKSKEVTMLIDRRIKPLLGSCGRYPYIDHYRQKYGDVPLWAVTNALTFGTISKFYELSKPQVQSAVSKEFRSINETQLRQILEVLTDFRNVCAHNERLFSHRCAKHDIPNLLLHKKLGIPKSGQEYMYGKRDYFSVVLSLRYLLPNAEFLTYKKELGRLIDDLCEKTKHITQTKLFVMMGLPGNWKKITAYKKD